MLSIGGCPRCGSPVARWAAEPTIRRGLAVAEVSCPAGHLYRSVWRSIQAQHERAARMRAAAGIMARVRDRLTPGTEERRIADVAARRLPVLAARAERGDPR